MLLQTGVAAQIETLVTLTGTTDFQSTKRLASLDGLRERYRHFLSSLGQRNIDVHGQVLAFATTTAKAGDLAALFSNDSVLDDKLQSEVIAATDDPERDHKQARVEDALHEICRYSHPYAEMLTTIVTDVFILPSTVARAGSTSQAVGVIWLNPKLSFPTPDLMEILIHEFIHQAMFLDELRHGHYSYGAISDRATWAMSAILNKARPLDKVLHSIVVATEVLLFRHLHIGQPAFPRAHPPTGIMLQQLEESLSSVESATRKFPSILTPRAKELVSNVRDILCHTLPALPSGSGAFATDEIKGKLKHAV